MPLLISRRLLISAGIASWATRGLAAATPYDLVTNNSRVAFSFKLSGNTQTGTVPVRTADIRVDTRNLAASSADVTTDIRQAKAGLVFVTQALLSPSVLDAQNHPIVRFKSTRIILGASNRISDGAQIEGNLTLRGVTNPLRLAAQLTRPAGTAANDLSVLNISLKGTLSRARFGATGYPKLVDDPVDLDIFAEIRARS
ncbi:MAG: YceI family protein [Paracoccaceae bacterium]|nr:YceI family protein [Paracoccaceae bacterium]